jgi:transmembrane sensor
MFVAMGLGAVSAMLIARATSSDADLPTEQLIATELGDWREVRLLDGTIATVGPGTKIAAHFNRKRRYMYVAGGDVSFKVTKDPTHPFVVETSRAQARALGTTFAVSHDANRTIVTTTEGLVGVSRRPYEPDPSMVETVNVAANESVVVDQWSGMKVRSIDPASELAWMERQIVFQRTWLPTAFDEFNRRNRTQISVPSHAHALAYRVTGRFRLDDPESFYRYVDDQLRQRASRQ